MDIGYYCLVSVLVLWGEFKFVLVSVSLLLSGVDVYGMVCLNYGDFDVVIIYLKVS